MMRIDSSRTFESLLVTPSNKPALRVIKRALGDGRWRPNVVLVCGPSGSGKTHLLHAIGNEVPAARLITAEQFLNQFVEEIRRGRMHAFREDMTSSWCLLVDNFEDLRDRPATHAELDRTIAMVIAKGGSAFLAMGPTTLTHARYTARAISAFGRGATVHWRRPAKPTRIAALERQLAERRFDIPRRKLEHLARRPTIPEARAALDNLLVRQRA